MRSFTLFIALAIANTSYADQYDLAKDKALEAALIQTGAKDFQNKLTHYFEIESKKYIMKLGVDKPLALGLYCSKVYRDKHLIIPLSSNETLNLRPNEISVDFRFGF